LAAISELLSLLYMSKKTIPGFTVRLYCLFFLLIIIFSELEWSKPVRDSAITTSWFWRGAFQIFVAALVYEVSAFLDSSALSACLCVLFFCVGKTI
jgi:hypothetical protein